MHTSRRFTLKVIALAAFCLTLMIPVRTAYGNVFNIADGDVPGLIAAINAANANAGPDTINLAPGGTYTLTQIAGPDAYHGPTGLPIVNGQLTLNGNGATIQRSNSPGTPDFRVLYALFANVVVDGVTIRGGRGQGAIGGGGGIYINVSTFLLRNSTITDNWGLEAGGIFNTCSALTIENSTISYNTGFGGRTGGGILNFGGCTSPISISNSTLYENRADGSPGFEGRGDAIADAFTPVGSIVIKNSIIASPTRGLGNECQFFTPDSRGHNIFGDTSCGQNVAAGDLIVPNLTLGSLAENGGSTNTHALLAGNVAIDAIPISECSNVAGVPILADQRGVARPQAARCDIGAYELLSVGGPATYDSRAGFTSDLCSPGATTSIDFHSKDDGTLITNPDSDRYFETLTLRGVTFRQVYSYYNSHVYTFPTAVLRVDLPVSTFAFGTDLSAFYGAAGTFTVTLSTGQTYRFGGNGGYFTGARRFFGVISSTPIEWATFSYDHDYVVVDDFIVGTSCDSTAPVITPTITGTPGNNGWYTSDVGVSWSVTDPESTVSSSSGCDATNVTTDTSGVILTCTATSAGGSDTQSVTIKRDATAPSISCGSADGSWHASDVSIACAGSDSISQLANAGDASFSLITNVTSGSETANAATDSRDVCDHAGNCSAAGPITGNKVDRKAPTITITTPTNAVYVLNQAVTASFNCQDGGSGVANCNGTAANGANVDTASVGSKTFTVSAADNVANEATPQSVSYTVSFGIGVLYDQTRAAKSGSTIPIKIQLVDALGHNMSSAGLVVHAASLVQIATTASETINDAGSSNPDANFRFDSSLGSSGGYIFNLKTTGLPTGTYRLGFTVDGDPTVYTVQFAVRQ